ncbi:helix-turn-helix transcriptional regulator [Tateyamaria sp.]|uniref:helix-turn-helix transcriptional regulator n=1 Tax=Tateyamaria sp. TaxID=1929288 RepID=UPI003B216E0B
MDFLTKERLAMTRDSESKAAAIRLKASRLYTGLSQDELGAMGGVKKAAINNIEKGRSFPARPLMTYLFREHRIDFNFLIYGEFAQLPSDVQERLFPLLQAVHNEWDQAASSN